MTTLEKGKFIKNFVRVERDGKLVRPTHSNFRGYSKKDVAAIEPQVDACYFEAWKKFLADKKADTDLQSKYADYAHYLYALNSVDTEDIKKYNLPNAYIIVNAD